jgi:hypothetical protein
MRDRPDHVEGGVRAVLWGATYLRFQDGHLRQRAQCTYPIGDGGY